MTNQQTLHYKSTTMVQLPFLWFFLLLLLVTILSALLFDQDFEESNSITASCDRVTHGEGWEVEFSDIASNLIYACRI